MFPHPKYVFKKVYKASRLSMQFLALLFLVDVLKGQTVDDPRPQIDTLVRASLYTRSRLHVKKYLRHPRKMAETTYKSPTEEALHHAKRPVDPARLKISKLVSDESSGFIYNQLKYEVPLKHHGNDDLIEITVRVVLRKNDPQVVEINKAGQPAELTVHLNSDKPIAVYLVGGPGSDNPHTNNPPMTEFYLEKGFQVLFMDYRGTGSSTLQRADHLNNSLLPNGNVYSLGKEPSLKDLSPEAQAEQLSWYRQDNIVRDLEAVRKSLLMDSGIKAARKWTLVGQSYGGWVSFTYLSFYPDALHMVLLTGGIPPVGQGPEQVYEHTYNKVIDACDKFYNKYDRHIKNVREILKIIHDGNGKDKDGIKSLIKMPGGGVLTPERFLCLGRTLGTTDGNDKVSHAIDKFIKDVNADEKTTYEMLTQIESWLRFEERPLYAILQEPIYTESPNPPSAWAAQAAGQKLKKHYWWLEEGAFDRVFSPKDVEDEKFADEHFNGKRIYMSAEHVYPFHYDQFKSLQPLKEAAQILAKKEDWPPLYDIPQLGKNKVPISSLSYKTDMFVSWELSERTVGKMDRNYIFNDKDEELMHTAVKDNPKVLERVWENIGTVAQRLVSREVRDEELTTASSVISVLEEAAAN